MNYKQQQKKIGQMIKKAREDKGMTYYRLTELTEVRHQQIKAVESGTKNFTTGTLIALDMVLKSGVLNEILLDVIQPVTD